MFGFRSDGKKAKDASLSCKALALVATERHDSQNLYNCSVDCAPLDFFIQSQLKEKGILFSYLDIVYTSLIRTLYNRPHCNKFVKNKTIYQRNGIFSSLVIKKELSEQGEMTMIKKEHTGRETINDIHDFLTKEIEINKNLNYQSEFDRILKKLLKIPGIILKPVSSLMLWMDRHGALPRKIVKISPFHVSFILSSLKSIKTDFIYHHLHDFGTAGLFVVLGKEKEVPSVDLDGNLIKKKIMQIGFTMDERFCDGFYWAKSLRILKILIENPHRLLEPLAAK